MHSTAEVSRILGMSEARVRELVRAGLCQAVRRGRGSLAAQLPADRSLSGLRIYADGQQVAVRDGDTAWHPETGQTVLDFGVRDIAASVERDRSRRATPAASPQDGPEQARAEFERALELEEVDLNAAREAYQRALLFDAGHADACVNLGRLVHEAGDAKRAAELYARALERSEDDPIVHFNLGLALEDSQGPEEAARHYRRALELAPDFADAHFNLAKLCEQLERPMDALRHYSAYKRLTEV
jgi:Tfp pilus assembly protein PilF